MTDPKTTLITQLQARNTELVEANLVLLRYVLECRFPDLPSGFVLLLDEYRKALVKHPTFPATVDGMGCTLSEELQEVAVAGMKAMQAVNDHRDDGLPLADVRREIAHVGVVVGRALEALDTELNTNLCLARQAKEDAA